MVCDGAPLAWGQGRAHLAPDPSKTRTPRGRHGRGALCFATRSLDGNQLVGCTLHWQKPPLSHRSSIRPGGDESEGVAADGHDEGGAGEGYPEAGGAAEGYEGSGYE